MTDGLLGFLAFVFFLLIVSVASYSTGSYSGSMTACTSVKMEWVKDKDKCMKVTREEVK